MLNLLDTALLRQQACINGQWCEADNLARFHVYNPASGELLAQVPNMGAGETQRAIDAAAAALPAWRARSAADRARILQCWFDLIIAHLEDLARLLTAEQGKPLQEARNEITSGAAYVEWFAQEARRAYGDVIPAHATDKRLLVLKEPVGVCAAITPWNFPSAMVTRKVAPALAAGCTVVLKPAEHTPLSAFALADLALRAGVPPGVLNVVTGDAPTIGRVLTGSPIVRKLSFTGSTKVGRLLMRQCADTVKKLSLELGGNAPLIVFEDADLDAAVTGAISAKFRNTGQTCICANRILVHAAIHDAFVEKFAAAVSKFKVGMGDEPGVQQGPLIDEPAVKKVEALLADAQGLGASVICGGKRHALGGTFFEPTVLCGVTATMRICHEEIFGPVAPVLRFQDEAEAIALANATEYGLAAYFYARDLSRVWRVAEALEYGMVGINTGLLTTEVAPFGGIKQSGIGREGSKYGIEEYLETKYLCIAV